MTARRPALVVLGFAAVAAVVASCHRAGTPAPPPPPAGDGPPPVADSPFCNTRPGVAYVGNARCADCHADIAAAYRSHPMARSLAPVSADDVPPGRFEAVGCHFSITPAADGISVHHVEKRDASGQVVAVQDVPVRYVMGSGTRGKSYLAEQAGRLTQSPASWYSQAGKWDLSPGFSRIFPQERVVESACLFCHANAAEAVPGLRNTFKEPVFAGGHGIGCERCHGPGALHADAPGDRGPGGPFDRTIVNPKHLPPVLREGVCQQCHLQGERRFERRGRGPFDYRPGLPLEDYWAVYVRGAGPAGGDKSVGHVEQMQASKCYSASGGALGCSSCHDPHRAPAAGDKVAFYRSRCLSCHDTGTPCKLPEADRRQQAPGDNCAGCHMPRYSSGDIVHLAVTNHRVPRRPDPAIKGKSAVDPLALTAFFANRRAGDPDVDRDRGLALVFADPSLGPRRAELAAVSVPLLEAAVARHPTDVAAADGLGWALTCLNQPADALAAFHRSLNRVPDQELTLILAAQAAEGAGALADAVNFRRRLVELNPYLSEYHTDLAKLLVRQPDAEGVRAAESAIRLVPLAREPRMLLVAGLLRQGDRSRATAELETLIRLTPKDEAALRRWFSQQK